MKSIFKLSVLSMSLAFANMAFAEQPIETEIFVIDEAEALAMDAKIYAENYGVSFDEAVNRLTVMLYGQEHADVIANTENSNLAGKYYDNSSDFGLVIKTKNPKNDKMVTFTPKVKENYGRLNSTAKHERNQLRKAIRSQLTVNEAQIAKAEEALSKPHKMKVKFHKSEITLAQLNQGMENLAKEAGNVEGYNFSFINERDGVINIILDREVHQNIYSKLKNIAKVPIVIEVIQSGMQPVANMRGGAKLYVNANVIATSPRQCMSAFGAVHNITKHTGLVTAAHCAPNMHVIATDGKIYPLTTHSNGTIDNRGSTNEADLRFLYNAQKNPLGVGEFHFDGTSNIRKVTATRSRVSTNVNKGTTVGSFVCHLGQEKPGSGNSIQSCGEVISTTGTLNTDANGNLSIGKTGGSFVVLRNTQSGSGTVKTSGTGTLKCYRGDSGGAVFAGTVAFGVVSACSWSDKVDSDNASYLMYTSTDYFNKLGVSIIVPK